MSYAYREAYAEVYYILQNMSETDASKIPPNIAEILKQDRLKNYNVNIDASIPLKEQKIKDETKAILAVLYRKFWSDENKREEIENVFLEKVKEESSLKLKSNEVKSKGNNRHKEIEYSPKVTIDNREKEINALIQYNAEAWYDKVFNRIRKMFKNK